MRKITRRGQQIILATDRPIGFWETRNDTRSLNSPAVDITATGVVAIASDWLGFHARHPRRLVATSGM